MLSLTLVLNLDISEGDSSTDYTDYADRKNNQRHPSNLWMIYFDPGDAEALLQPASFKSGSLQSTDYIWTLLHQVP
jgi:hypothetical protein